MCLRARSLFYVYSSSSSAQRELSAPACQKNTAACSNHHSTWIFEQRMLLNTLNYPPAYLDDTEHRFAMDGWNGNVLPFYLFLPFSSGRRPSAYHPSPSASKMRKSKLSVALRAKNNFRVSQKLLREITTTAHVFFLTRMARIFRNYHPAHLDSTEHRNAMGGWHGNLLPFYLFLPFSLSPQSVGPLLTTPPPLHRRCKTPNSLRLCVLEIISACPKNSCAK